MLKTNFYRLNYTFLIKLNTVGFSCLIVRTKPDFWPNLQVQQTPNPAAQVPAAKPFLVAHSDLKFNVHFTNCFRSGYKCKYIF